MEIKSPQKAIPLYDYYYMSFWTVTAKKTKIIIEKLYFFRLQQVHIIILIMTVIVIRSFCRGLLRRSSVLW